MAFLAFDDGLGGTTNLLLHSEDFSTASWTKTNVSVSADATIGPDGGTFHGALTSTSTTGCLCTQTATATATTLTYSLFIKRGTGATDANTYGLFNTTTASDLRFVSVNFDTGIVTDVIGSGGAQITAYSGGFYRLSLTVSSGISIGNTIKCYAAFTGGTVSLGAFSYAWGAELHAGSTVGAYVATTTATATAASLCNDYPVPANRFANWTPSTRPYGDSVNTLGTGALVMFRMRTDSGASFDLVGIPVKAQSDGVNYADVADRLVAHLLGGGTVSVQTGDRDARIYPTCGLAPGSTPSLVFSDRTNLLYSLSLQVLNLATSPIRMTAVYAA